MLTLKRCCVLFVVVLLLCEISSKRTGSGGRRTSSSSSSGWGWSRPKSNPKPQTNYGHTSQTNVDNRRLSYGSDTAPKPSAPVDSRPVGSNTGQMGWNVPGTNTQQKNVGWNTAPNPGEASKPNIGWNVPNSQGGYNQPKSGQVPPPYPGGSSYNPAPPPYPGLGTQHHSSVGNAPPPYPGLGTQHHSSVGNAPPPYSGYGGQHQPPPAYPGQTSNRFGQSNYPQQQTNYGYHPYGQQSHNSWSTPGFGSPGFGSPFGGGYNRGGYGGGGFGGGGFGGGGFGGGYSPYKQKSGFGGIGSHVGTFLAGAMLWNLASNVGRSNYQVYHNSPPPSYNQQQTYRGPNGTEYKVTHDNTKPNEAKMSVDFGNMSCITIYNADKFSKWANRTISNIEYQTKQAFPFGNFANLQNGTQSGQIQFNFTIEPGKIIHNETVSITCCGTEHVALEFEDILSGRDPTANCVHLAAQIPFRSVKVVPLNVTVNITNKDLELLANATLTNATDTSNTTATPITTVIGNTTAQVNLTTVETTTVNLTAVETTTVNLTATETTTHAAILNDTTTASADVTTVT